MTFHRNAKDGSNGWDYMANSGIEERDRDHVGIIIAVGIMIFLTLTQYLKLY